MDKLNFFSSITHDDEVRIYALSEATIEIMELIKDGMNPERKKALEDAIVAIDDLIGSDFVVDSMIRHNWPEEKPEREGHYLVKGEWDGTYKNFDIAFYCSGGWGGLDIDKVTHWWELPEFEV